MQVLKSQAQLSQLNRTDFLAGTEFIVGKNIELTLTVLPLVTVTIFIARRLLSYICARRQIYHTIYMYCDDRL
jgi:hypothetical protein